MSYTETQIINKVSTVLQDAGTAIWGTQVIRRAIDEGLIALADGGRPYVTLGTVTTSAGTKTIDVSSESDVLYVDKVEFRLNSGSTGSLDPPRFRNFKEISPGQLLLEIDFDPDASENVRVYYAKPHVLSGTATNTMDPREEQILINWAAGKVALDGAMNIAQQVESAITDLASAGSAVDNMSAQIASATAAINSGTQYINAKTLASDPTGQWLNTAMSDLSAAGTYLNQASGYISKSAGRLAASNASAHYERWGINKVAMAERDLRKIARKRVARDYPRDA